MLGGSPLPCWGAEPPDSGAFGVLDPAAPLPAADPAAPAAPRPASAAPAAPRGVGGPGGPRGVGGPGGPRGVAGVQFGVDHRRFRLVLPDELDQLGDQERQADEVTEDPQRPPPRIWSVCRLGPQGRASA